MRGKTENMSDFRAILNYRAEKDGHLKEHLTFAPKYAKYLSSKMQNEFSSLCGTQISTTITERCRSAQYFTVMADESADVSNIEQFAFCVRFTEKSASDIHSATEEFLSFAST